MSRLLTPKNQLIAVMRSRVRKVYVSCVPSGASAAYRGNAMFVWWEETDVNEVVNEALMMDI